MKKKLIVVIAFLFLTLSVSAVVPDAYASHKDKEGGYHKGKSCHAGYGSKVYKKASFVLSNREELGLSDEQVQKIKDLKVKSKKDMIKKKAEIDVLAVDIKAHMYQDPIDINAVNKLIDRKYDLKKEKAKASLKACADLKNILTEEQKTKLKSLCKTHGKGKK